MSLLAFVMGQGEPTGTLSTSITGTTARSLNSSSLSLTGANAGQLCIIVHSAYNTSGALSTPPSTPTGFTSLSSYPSAGANPFGIRISYKILTANEATFTLPAVSDANQQIATSKIISVTSGTISSISISQTSGYDYVQTTTGDPGASGNGNVSGVSNDILLGFFTFTPPDSISTTSFSSPSITSSTYSSGPPVGSIVDYYLFTTAKVLSTSGSGSWSTTAQTTFRDQVGYSSSLYNTFKITPTFI